MGKYIDAHTRATGKRETFYRTVYTQMKENYINAGNEY